MPDIYYFIYTLPLWQVVAVMAAGTVLWGAAASKLPRKSWQRLNLILVALAALTVLYATVFCRESSEPTLILKPFAALAAAKEEKEAYRALLMNVFLFFPLGLAVSNALPQSLSMRARAVLTAGMGCVFSVLIESTQYRFALGTAETDDVICNAAGALLGALSLILKRYFDKGKG